MSLTRAFVVKELENGIKIFIVQDHLMENDLIIKFKNYGAVIDHHFNIMGFQHLLEHCFFFQNDNYNLFTNASTSFSDMNIEISFQDRRVYPSNPTLLVIKNWFFKNNDLTKLDFSRKLTLDEIRLYINELDNEFVYRDLLSIHWGLQTFCLSNKDCHYFGGNQYSFYNKEYEIIEFLQKPFPVPNEDINIYLRASSYPFYKEIVNIFGHIKKIKKPELSFNYNREKFFNKVVQINRDSLNELIFIMDRDILSIHDLVKLTLLFNNFSFSENSYINEYYLSFTYHTINDLCQIIIALEKTPELFLKQYLTNDPISDNILYYEMFEIIPSDVLTYISNNIDLSKVDYYERERKLIKKFIGLLKQAVLNKEYIINTKIDNFYKYQTKYDEPYNIFDINFNFKNFFNSSSLDKQSVHHDKRFKCNQRQQIISVDLKNKNIQNNMFMYLNKDIKPFKPSIYFYFETLIVYFSMPNFLNLKHVVDDFHKHKFYNILKIQPLTNVVLSNKMYVINTEYDFLFLCFQVSNKFIPLLRESKTNLTHRLKKLGLLYHLDSVHVQYDKKSLIFYYTSCRKEGMEKIINYIKASFVSNNIPYKFNIVKSETSFFNDLSSLQKDIVMKY